MRFSYNLTSRSVTVSISIEDTTRSISLDKVIRWINTSQEIFLSPADIKATPLIQQNMSPRALNALKKNGITTLEELMDLSSKELESIDSIGRKTKNEIEKFKNYITGENNE